MQRLHLRFKGMGECRPKELRNRRLEVQILLGVLEKQGFLKGATFKCTKPCTKLRPRLLGRFCLVHLERVLISPCVERTLVVQRGLSHETGEFSRPHP